MTEPSNDTRRSEELVAATQYIYTRTHAREASVPQPGESAEIGGIDIHPSKLAEHLCAFKGFRASVTKLAHLAQSWHICPPVSREHSKSWRETIMASRCRGELRATRSPRISR
jgi:hypothetical protein